MPSEDPINPEANRWLYRDAKGKLHEITRQEPGRVASRTAQAAQVQALAARLGIPAEKLAETIPEETLRRLKFPVIETAEPDGTSSFRHDVGVIRDGITPLLRADKAHEAIEKGADGRGAGAPQPRTDSGRFSK